MSEATGGAPAADDERQRVAAMLARVRAGVEQRQAELATVEADREDTRLALAELRRLELVEEPFAVSPRPVVGRWLVLLRKAVFHLLGKWYARPVLQQQNAYNRAAARLLRDLAEREAAAAERLAALGRRVDALEGRGRPPDVP